MAGLHGLVGEISHLAIDLDLSITDRAGVAITYHYRANRMIQKAHKPRSAKTDYCAFLMTLDKDTRAEGILDFADKTDSIKKERGEKRAIKEKGNEAKKKHGMWNVKDKRLDGRCQRKRTAAEWADRGPKSRDDDRRGRLGRRIGIRIIARMQSIRSNSNSGRCSHCP